MPLTSTFTSRALVRKFNPNHGPDGRFASAGGGRRGGTAGPPTEDAFGNPLRRNVARAGAAGRLTSPAPLGAATHAINTATYGSTGSVVNPAKHVIENAAGPNNQFSNEQKQRNYVTMFGKRPR
jgi:hypothetical protein